MQQTPVVALRHPAPRLDRDQHCPLPPVGRRTWPADKTPLHPEFRSTNARIGEAEPSLVDKFNVTAGSTVTSEIGEQTAGTTRTYYGVINAMPGVTADAENDDIQQTRPSVNGTHFADQGVYIDGVDTTFAKFGGSRVFLPTTAVTEVSMEAGGSSAEYGRYVGSSTNVIVKSGTNRWHTDVLWEHQAVDWGADYKNQPSLAERRTRPYPEDWFRRCHGDSRDDGRDALGRSPAKS